MDWNVFIMTFVIIGVFAFIIANFCFAVHLAIECKWFRFAFSIIFLIVVLSALFGFASAHSNHSNNDVITQVEK